MSLLVRDERDVIEQNIRYHAAHGVDYFIITDNISVDGTREIVEGLSSEFDIHIIDEASHTLDQDLWVTRMAHYVHEHGLADWIINADADEFWTSHTGSLKEDIRRADAAGGPFVFNCARFNLYPVDTDLKDHDYQFFWNVMKVHKPLGLHPVVRNLSEEFEFEALLRTMPQKVMCKLEGLQSVGMGNHSVVHSGGPPVTSPTMEIYHFPVRSYEQFKSKVRNQGESLRDNRRLDRTNGWHARRWFEQFEAGQLDKEYMSFVLTDDRVKDLLDRDLIIEDRTIFNFFHTLDEPGPASHLL